MRFSFSILINANLCSLSTQKQSHCFSITIMACIFHGGNTFHKPCQAIDFSIWYVLFWLVRGTLHKQFGHRIPSSGWCRPWKCFDISRSVICFLWSFHLKRRWSLRNLISRLFPVLVFNFPLIYVENLGIWVNIFYFPWKPFSVASKYGESITDQEGVLIIRLITSLNPFLRIKMPSLVSDRNLIRLNLTFDIKNIERKLAIRSVCIPNPFCYFFFFQHYSTFRFKIFPEFFFRLLNKKIADWCDSVKFQFTHRHYLVILFLLLIS